MYYSYYNTNHLSQDENFLAQKLALFTKQVQEESPSFAQLDFVDNLIKSLQSLTPYLQSFKHMILLGVGGSALGPKALQESFCPQGARAWTNREERRLWIIDNTDMPLFTECLEHLPAEETLVLVISKSGSTLSTIAQYHIAKKWLQNSLPEVTGQNSSNHEKEETPTQNSLPTSAPDSAFTFTQTNWQKHIFVITDKNKGFLREEVQKYDYVSLSVPTDMSGRFSLFSPVGMVSSAFLGLDYVQFLQGAQSARDEFFMKSENFIKNYQHEQSSLPPLYKMAYFAYECMEAEFSQLIFFSYIPKWERLGEWFRQLWSESLGKYGHGSTPIPTLGATDQHSILQLFLDGKKDKACLFLTHALNTQTNVCIHSHNAESTLHSHIPQDIPQEWEWIAGKSLRNILDAEALATRTTLANSGMPLIHLDMTDISEYAFGKITWDLCMFTIMTAYFLEINPFDQPAVEEGKKMTKASLSQSK